VSILIIDDSKVDRIVTKVVLQKGGFEDLITAQSAVQALALLGVPEGEPEIAANQLDVILVDRRCRRWTDSSSAELCTRTDDSRTCPLS